MLATTMALPVSVATVTCINVVVEINVSIRLELASQSLLPLAVL